MKLNLGELIGLNDFTYLKEEIKANRAKYILKWESRSLGPRETIYLFEELANSRFIFNGGGRFGRFTEQLFCDGYFEVVINDEDKFLKHIDGVQVAKNKTTADLYEEWKTGKLSTESERASFVFQVIQEQNWSLIKGDRNTARVFMWLLDEKFVLFLANEDAIEKFLEMSGLK